jgi:hypothetical protein
LRKDNRNSRIYKNMFTAETPYRFFIFLKNKESGIVLIPFALLKQRSTRRQENPKTKKKRKNFGLNQKGYWFDLEMSLASLGLGGKTMFKDL